MVGGSNDSALWSLICVQPSKESVHLCRVLDDSDGEIAWFWGYFRAVLGSPESA